MTAPQRPEPPTAGPLTEAQRDAVVRWVFSSGYERKRRLAAFREDDFLAGWIMLTLAGRDVLTADQADRAAGLAPEAPPPRAP
jgi:hypothetical protein